MDDNARRRPVVIVDDDEPEAKRIRLDRAVMPTPTPTTTFDSKSTCTLFVRDGDPSTFLVCSRTLARASPVFDKMLFGPFVEARPSPELSKQESAWVVHLPEDDPNHLGVVLNILHCNFKMVPQNFSSPLLSGMVAVADKYDCIEIFRPWVNSCIPSLDYDHFHNPKFVLHISWHLGCIATFRQALLAIIEHSFISEMDEIFIFTRPQSTGRMPPWEEPQDLHEYLGNLVPVEVIGQYHVSSILSSMSAPV
ncbi:nuclear pore protein-like protein [Colletotrichum asianum]